MSALRLFGRLLYWDVLREVRRRETIPNMTLFAILVLFIGIMGVGTDRDAALRGEGALTGAGGGMGPVLFWVAILFAGTIGLSLTFAAEREGNRLVGIVTAPIDLGLFYLVKVASAWLYVTAMEILVTVVYMIFFNFWPGDRLLEFAAVLAGFTLTYMAAGVLLASLTAQLGAAGEVVLRILAIPFMLPVIWVTLRVSAEVFNTPIAGGSLEPMDVGHYLGFTGALSTIYLTAGYVLFPLVVEE